MGNVVEFSRLDLIDEQAIADMNHKPHNLYFHYSSVLFLSTKMSLNFNEIKSVQRFPKISNENKKIFCFGT